MQIGGTGVSQQEAANSPLCFDKGYGVWWKLVRTVSVGIARALASSIASVTV